MALPKQGGELGGEGGCLMDPQCRHSPTSVQGAAVKAIRLVKRRRSRILAPHTGAREKVLVRRPTPQDGRAAAVGVGGRPLS